MTDDLAVTLTKGELRALVAEAVAEALDEGRSERPTPAEVMTRSEAASFLRCSLGQLDRLVRDAGLPWHRMGDSKRFFRSDLAGWLRNGGSANG